MTANAKTVTSEDYADASQTEPDAWQYVSEGGATIVFSYRGPEHPVFTGTVLRLRKIGLDQLSASDRDFERDVDADVEEPDDPTIAFQHRITSKLISPSFLPRLETVRVERSWLENLQRISDAIRPQERKQKDTIDVSRRKAVLATDLVGGDGWSVEIKPKWGFLPNPTHLSPETKDVKIRRCRYCLHDQYRSKKAEGVSHEYCPLDLFSGDEGRVSIALRRLWDGWTQGGSFNNLRIFVHGKLLNANEAGTELSLFGPNGNKERSAEGGQTDELPQTFVATLLPFLLETPVFKRLSHLQRTLDALDIEGLFALHAATQVSSSIPALEELFSNPSIDEWERFVDAYLDAGFQASLNHEKPDSQHLQYYALAYLLSASFKDCSVIIRANKSDGDPYSITVIDLDPKGMDRLRKWYNLDRTLAISFEDDGQRRCIDSN